MTFERKKKISATGTFRLNVIAVDNSSFEWLDAMDFNLPALAKGIGIHINHKVRATITLELTEEPCIICGRPTAGDKICQNCGKPVCDMCAETEEPERYCPICKVIKQPASAP